MSYCPVPGLVTLFARTTTYTQNPRAPHSRPLAASGFSYGAVIRSLAMDNGRFNGGDMGTKQHFDGAPSVQGSGQGLSFNRGSFQPRNHAFHPSYVGCGPYTGFGGGRYGGRGAQPLAHHPSFVAQRGRDSGGFKTHQGQGVGGFDARGSTNNGRVE
jgi:hypothetical protein